VDVEDQIEYTARRIVSLEVKFHRPQLSQDEIICPPLQLESLKSTRMILPLKRQ